MRKTPPPQALPLRLPPPNSRRGPSAPLPQPARASWGVGEGRKTSDREPLQIQQSSLRGKGRHAARWSGTALRAPGAGPLPPPLAKEVGLAKAGRLAECAGRGLCDRRPCVRTGRVAGRKGRWCLSGCLAALAVCFSGCLAVLAVWLLSLCGCVAVWLCGCVAVLAVLTILAVLNVWLYS